MYCKLDLVGQKFGRLTVIEKVKTAQKGVFWKCKCECGNEKVTSSYKLRSGKTKSCGCMEKENLKTISKHSLKHGMSDTILYGKWCAIKERCFNPNYKHYDRYGGRGITMCPEWQGEHGFENFAMWAYQAGYDESKNGYDQSIDRINIDGDYEPSNCQWSNQVEQVKNRSNARLIKDLDGEELTSYQFNIKHNITADMFTYRRLVKGLSAKDILDEWNDYLNAIVNGKYYTLEKASEFYKVSPETIKIWAKKKLLESKKIRNKIYILKGQQRPYSK